MNVIGVTGSVPRSDLTDVRDVLNHAGLLVRDISLVGSKYIQGFGNDSDVLVLVQMRCHAVEAFQEVGYTVEGEPSSGGAGDEFESLRLGEINVLLTEDAEFFEKWIRSAEVCKYVRGRYGHCHRDDRVKIHQLIMDN